MLPNPKLSEVLELFIDMKMPWAAKVWRRISKLVTRAKPGQRQ